MMAPSAALPSLIAPDLIGRDGDLEAVGRVLDQPSVRLLTITGGGGFGKRSVAMAVGQTRAANGDQRVVVVELAPLGDPSLALPAIAREIGAVVPVDDDLVTRVVATLDEEPTLLILDNLEHLDVAALVAQLLAATRQVSILATSRTRLHLKEERIYSLDPLQIPDEASGLSTERLEANPAVQLLVERIRDVHPTFELTRVNAQAVQELSQWLEGIPLAIELVASHARLLSVGEMLTQLEERQDVLRGGAIDQPDRLRAMEASVAWSLNLLPPDTQAAFCQLCVFRGLFDLNDAVSVAGIDLTVVGQLIDHGLVSLHPNNDAPHQFRILAPVREQGLQMARQTGEFDAIHIRHAAYLFDLAGRLARHRTLGEAESDLDVLALRRDDFFFALDWTLGYGELDAAVRASVDARGFWLERCDPQSSLAQMSRVVQTVDGSAGFPVRVRAGLYHAMAEVAYHVGDLEISATFLDRAIALAQEHGPPTVLALSLVQRIAIWRAVRQVDRARELVDLAAAAVAVVDTPYTTMRFHFEVAAISLHQRDLDEADRHLALSMAAADRLGMGAYKGGIEGLQALVHIARGNYDEARTWYHHALQTPHASVTSHYSTLQGAARVELHDGQPLAAAPILRECLEVRQRRGNQVWINAALIDCGWLAVLLDDDPRAVDLFAAARIDIRTNIDLLVVEAIDTVVAGIVDRLGEAQYQTRFRLGSLRDRDEVIAETLVWLDLLAENPVAVPVDKPVLSRREREVLALIAKGVSTVGIGEALFISRHTADTHIKHIYRKLGVRTRAAAVSEGVRLSLIDVD